MSETLREGVDLLAWTLDEAADEAAEVGAETGAVVTVQVELRRSLARDLRALLAATDPTPGEVRWVEGMSVAAFTEQLLDRHEYGGPRKAGR